MNSTSSAQPTALLIAALGGEGGGALAEWLVDAATRAGLPVQATSVPGVAQRTGATSYYIEWLAAPAPAGAQPVFALMPVPGRVDILLASELLEATRMVERGFVSPERTLLITARHRVLTTAEKMAMGDGRFDSERLLATVQGLAQHCLALDLQALTARHRTVISAVLFGALAGSGRLPWPRAVSEAVIRDSGLGVEASLAGFAAAFDAAAAALPHAALPAPSTAAPAALSDPGLPSVLALAEARLTDYQNAAYAARYRARIAALQATLPASADPEAEAALSEAARHLALWMSYEDVIRVADLKTRRERFERVRAEAQAGPDDIVQIREHLKPGLDEIAAIAPRRLGQWLMQRAQRRQAAAPGPRGNGITLHTSSIRGFLTLRLLAALRPLRPHSLRFAEEDAAIETWLAALAHGLPLHAGFARQLAQLPRLRKGYSDTFVRGKVAYERVFDTCVAPRLINGHRPDDDAARALAQAITAALADPEHQALNHAIGAPPAAPRSGGGSGGGSGGSQPLVFHPRVSHGAGGPGASR
ncbi:MAG: hypothetical protein A3E25_14935 [Burkholderiales bacterium RIFCSPHIGHO2_12_FULL_69_20]|nr:MAG: hypothetical protein A3E25_14935 [Burkholderiales bacterium RIFCSPHIGHO2_12_FULL_69_20]